jgi:hypothetical protein
VQSQFELWGKSLQPRFCERVSGCSTHHADLMAGRRLRGSKINDMAEKSANGCPEAMQDIQGRGSIAKFERLN